MIMNIRTEPSPVRLNSARRCFCLRLLKSSGLHDLAVSPIYRLSTVHHLPLADLLRIMVEVLTLHLLTKSFFGG